MPKVFQNLNAIPISRVEFPVAARDYPIVFVASDGKRFAPVAEVGIEDGQNLFVLPGNEWEPAAYFPAYVRRYPFCMAKVTVDGREQAQRLACVETLSIHAKGDNLFDQAGNPTPTWVEREKLLFEYEQDLARTEALCGVLAELDLLEPMTMQAKTPVGESLNLAGMHRVTEARLAAVDHAKLRALFENGSVARIYAHLLSLDNFPRLLERRAAARAAK
ncbi:MAG: SapC family protein [Burkholderiales bacterium]